MIIKYHHLADGTDQGSFNTPKSLYTNKGYRDLGMAEKQLYAILLDKAYNEIGFDENGLPFITYGVKELANICGVSTRSIIRYKQNLSDYGLIEEVKRGQGKLNRIYVYKPIGGEG